MTRTEWRRTVTRAAENFVFVAALLVLFSVAFVGFCWLGGPP